LSDERKPDFESAGVHEIDLDDLPTEVGILHKMAREAPDKQLIAAPPEDEGCACNMCPHMRKNTLEKLYLCLRDLQPRIEIDAGLRVRALRPIERMLELSR